MVSCRYIRIKLIRETRIVDIIVGFIIFIVLFGIITDLHTKLLSNKIDWHDWELIKADKQRTGIGEHGEAAHLSTYPENSKNINETYGYNGYLSDRIALDRSLKDLRPIQCMRERYAPELPTVSVVIIFYNEYTSVLLRACYSVWKRSPSHLLKEIILVDDASTIVDDLHEFIDVYLPIVKLIRLKNRSGLIKARLVGAEAAKGDVLVFLDSHVEAYHNWLPPLLDPIVNDYRTVMCPTIDIISSENFRYARQDLPSGYAGRGSFDWNFNYKLLPLLPKNLRQISKPFENPIMAGGLFAITAKFFWELGGYDNGLEIYGGEQYELSFKIWQCGGRMLENACSRFGHIYRHRKINPNAHLTYDFFHRNYKRVAEVWMDEYKEYIYNRNAAYSSIDAGDLSEQKALRERLQCKSFKWFLDNVAFDIFANFPLHEPSYAYGGIRNLGMKHLCVDTLSKDGYSPLGLYSCSRNISISQYTQSFSLTLTKDIRQRFEQRCWKKYDGNRVRFAKCIYNGQPIPDELLWEYNLHTKWIINKHDGFCLDVDTTNLELILNECNIDKANMKWEFGNINHTAFLIDGKV